MTTDDPYDDPRFRAWVARTKRDLIPKLADSEVMLSIVPADAMDTDIKFAVELGLGIMMDKPIILMVRPGTRLPDHLVRVADDIIEGDISTEGTAVAERIQAALDRLFDR